MIFFRTEGLFSALLFLSMALDFSQQKQIDLKLTSAPPERASSKSVMLECSPVDKNDLVHGVFWFRQPPTLEPPQFILHDSVRQKMGDNIDSNRFKGSKTNMIARLEIKAFRKEDQGVYHCLININSVLHFSTGVRLSYPTATTPAPSSTPAATLCSKSNCCQTSPSERHYKAEENAVPTSPLDLSCSLYIWVPHAVVSLLLLLAFLVTLSHLCKFFIRRKRCKHHAKKRPISGNNAKPNPPV